MAMVDRYPVLLLLVPYVSGLVFGPAAFIAWAFKAALSSRPASSLETEAAIKNLIPVLVAAAALPFSSPPSPPQEEGALVVLEGPVKDGPWQRPGLRAGWEMYIASEDPVITGTFRVWSPVASPLAVQVGDRVRLKGQLKVRGRVTWVETRNALIHEMGEDAGLHPLRHVYGLRRRLWRGLQASLDRDAAALVAAMLLGLPGKVEGSVKELFRCTGTAHLLAISGLHVGLISLMLIAFLKRLGFTERCLYWPVISSLVFFCFLTGGRVPVQRACLVCAFHLYAARTHRPLDPFTPLFNACMVLLVIDPLALRDLSFQLSFAGYSGVLIFLKARSSARGVSGRQGLKKASVIRGKVVTFLGVSTSSWLATLPLILHYFQRFNPWTPLINLGVFPFFLAALLGGAVHLIAVGLDLHQSLITVWPCETSISLLLGGLATCGSLPPGAVSTPPFPWIFIVLCYGVMLALFFGWVRRPWARH